MARAPTRSELEQVPAIPLDDDGAVFRAPWEAKVFALVVSLNQHGHFSWTEWAATISDEIERDKSRPVETPYYELWLAAAERIIDAKGLCAADDMARMKDAIRAEQQHAHDHTH